MATRATRPGPNVLVTGTPGCGKSTLSQLVATAMGGRVEHIDVSDFVKTRGLHEGWDAERECFILDEDRVRPQCKMRHTGAPRLRSVPPLGLQACAAQLLDELELVTEQGWKIVDYHSSELFPERWFDLVVVLQTDNAVLYQRLEARGYNERKIQENVECEIMQVVRTEAHEAYDESIIWDLQSDTLAQMEDNVQRIVDFFEQGGH